MRWLPRERRMEEEAPSWTLGTAYTCQLCGQVFLLLVPWQPMLGNQWLATFYISVPSPIRPSWVWTCFVTTWKSATSQPTRLTGGHYQGTRVPSIWRPASSRLHPELLQHGSFFFCKICFTSITWDTKPLTIHFSSTHKLSLRVGSVKSWSWKQLSTRNTTNCTDPPHPGWNCRPGKTFWKPLKRWRPRLQSVSLI